LPSLDPLSAFALLTYSRCWVQDDKEGWVGAEVASKNVDDTKVTLVLKLENGEVCISLKPNFDSTAQY
jgi:myosin heavy subunit